MGLVEYRRKRDFSTTSEPKGDVRKSQGALSFVIQKHAATHLHYDFRLEFDGVLKSWAVPKGPDLNPATKRLAMHVEDHPVEYGKFEGIIPQGQYGGRAVLLWDRGTWEPMGDPKRGFRDGSLKFVLHGEKLQGNWMLVRRGGRAGDADERHWFLFKERDKFAKATGKSITEQKPLSVASGRTMEQIAEAADRVWGSTAVKEHASRKVVRTKTNSTQTASAEFAGVELTHPDKVLYPDQGLTKADLARYYLSVADWILPQVVHRPLALVRCPAGSKKPCFFQKHPGEGASEHLKRVDVSESNEPNQNMMLADAAGLISLVQMGVLEIHVWGARSRSLEKPDRLVFDLDPDPNLQWPQVITAAREVRLFLQELGLESFVKTTGGKGLHLVVPVQSRLGWDESKAFCRRVAELLEEAAPDRYISTMSKAARKGKIFVDYLRNGRGATAVAAYSTRARDGAPISVPLAWDELSPRLRSDYFTIQNLPARLQRLKLDPWAALPTLKQSLTKSMLKRLGVDE
ncbi:MAG: non-homologous end-joining DNA ligase [Planctomycetia bacterium]|nr:non-homologous end-joining DNA ligase [Planctomycetia bacterium]